MVGINLEFCRDICVMLYCHLFHLLIYLCITESKNRMYSVEYGVRLPAGCQAVHWGEWGGGSIFSSHFHGLVTGLLRRGFHPSHTKRISWTTLQTETKPYKPVKNTSGSGSYECPVIQSDMLITQRLASQLLLLGQCGVPLRSRQSPWSILLN